MALITSQEIKSNTSMGGNVDPDKFMHLLTDVEVLILEPILGTALFDKIVTDFKILQTLLIHSIKRIIT